MSSRNQSKRTRHYPAASVRFVGHRDRSHPLSLPLSQPDLENATTSSISGEGASVFQSASSPFVSLFPQLHPLHPYANLFCASVRAPAYTRSSAGPSRACCRCSGEGHKLNDVNALSTLCRRGETTHDPLSPSTHPYHPHFSVPLSLHRPSSDLDDPRQPLTRPLLTDYNYRGVPCGSPRMDEEER